MAPKPPPPKKHGPTPLQQMAPTPKAVRIGKGQTPVSKVVPSPTPVRGQTPIAKVQPPKKP